MSMFTLFYVRVTRYEYFILLYRKLRVTHSRVLVGYICVLCGEIIN